MSNVTLCPVDSSMVWLTEVVLLGSSDARLAELSVNEETRTLLELALGSSRGTAGGLWRKMEEYARSKGAFTFDYHAAVHIWRILIFWLCIFLFCDFDVIVLFCHGSRMGEWRLFRRLFASDCLSLQPGCPSETHWAAEWSLLAGQVSNRDVIFTEIHFILKSLMATSRFMSINCHF